MNLRFLSPAFQPSAEKISKIRKPASELTTCVLGDPSSLSFDDGSQTSLDHVQLNEIDTRLMPYIFEVVNNQCIESFLNRTFRIKYFEQGSFFIFVLK